MFGITYNGLSATYVATSDFLDTSIERFTGAPSACGVIPHDVAQALSDPKHAPLLVEPAEEDNYEGAVDALTEGVRFLRLDDEVELATPCVEDLTRRVALLSLNDNDALTMNMVYSTDVADFVKSPSRRRIEVPTLIGPLDMHYDQWHISSLLTMPVTTYTSATSRLMQTESISTANQAPPTLPPTPPPTPPSPSPNSPEPPSPPSPNETPTWPKKHRKPNPLRSRTSVAKAKIELGSGRRERHEMECPKSHPVARGPSSAACIAPRDKNAPLPKRMAEDRGPPSQIGSDQHPSPTESPALACAAETNPPNGRPKAKLRMPRVTAEKRELVAKKEAVAAQARIDRFKMMEHGSMQRAPTVLHRPKKEAKEEKRNKGTITTADDVLLDRQDVVQKLQQLTQLLVDKVIKGEYIDEESVDRVRRKAVDRVAPIWDRCHRQNSFHHVTSDQWKQVAGVWMDSFTEDLCARAMVLKIDRPLLLNKWREVAGFPSGITVTSGPA